MQTQQDNRLLQFQNHEPFSKNENSYGITSHFKTNSQPNLPRHQPEMIKISSYTSLHNGCCGGPKLLNPLNNMDLQL